LAAALFEAGRTAEATRVADEAIAVAPDDRLRVRAQVERELIRLETETSAGTEQARQVTETGESALADDDYGLCRLAFLRGRITWDIGQVAAAEAAWAEAAELARHADAQRELFELVGWRALAAVLGPTPVDDAIRQCEDWRELVRASPLATASTLNPLAVLHAMEGDVERADALLAEAAAILSELGGLTAAVGHLAGWVWLLTGRPERAETALRAHMETATEGSALATTTALLAQAVLAQSRPEEAGELSRAAARHAAADDTATQILWRGVAARVAGSSDEAETLAREAVAMAERTDLLWFRGAAMLDLATVLRTRNRSDDAERAERAGWELMQRKGCVPRRN
jgi:tetratricopeptide (TPR) repeat protein